MKFLIRIFERILLFFLSIAVVLGIFNFVFDPLDEHFSLRVSLILTYFIAAYGILPRAVFIIISLFRKGHIPRFSRARDGLPADPVNIILLGSENDLKHAFKKAQWQRADPLSFKSGWKMVQSLIFNTSYPKAPFSSLFLFGRVQDHGFEQALKKSPRSRHHIRFWAADHDILERLFDVAYWKKKNTADPKKSMVWIGSGTLDTGIGLKKFTYQLTHRTDKNIDEERDYILSSLKKVNAIKNITSVNVDEFVSKKYISDGKIIVADLRRPRQQIQ